MNSCVKRVAVREGDHALPSADFACVFPNADSLELSTDKKGSELCNHLASSSSCFLGNLRALQLGMDSDAAARAAVSALLPRYTPFSCFHVL
jgi:hypothetical protein